MCVCGGGERITAVCSENQRFNRPKKKIYISRGTKIPSPPVYSGTHSTYPVCSGNKKICKKWLNFGLVTNIYYRLFFCIIKFLADFFFSNFVPNFFIIMHISCIFGRIFPFFSKNNINIRPNLKFNRWKWINLKKVTKFWLSD